MDRTSATKLEGMVIISRELLHALAEYARENVPGERRRAMIVKIATAMTELVDVSRMIYEEFPDLNPHREEERIAAMTKKSPSSQ